MANKSRADIRRSVHSRIRKKVRGTSARPRLAVYRSTNHIYAQVIDDETGKTLAAASTVEKDFKGKPGGNIFGGRGDRQNDRRSREDRGCGRGCF